MTWKPKGKTEFTDDVVVEAGNVGIGTSSPASKADVAGTIRATNVGDPATGAGLEMHYNPASGTGQILAYDRTGSTWRPLRLLGGTTSIAVEGTERFAINNAGLITGTGRSLGAWTPYTPTLGNWTLGNGVLEGAYCQIGKTIHCRIVIVLGSTTTISNFPSLGVPLTAQNTSHAFAYGAGANDTSAGTSYIMSARWASTTSVAVFGTGGVNGTELGVGTTLPFAWASGDLIRIAMTYEAA